MNTTNPDFNDLSEREKFEEKLTILHETTRKLMDVDNPQAVCEMTINVAVDLLDIPIASVYLYDEDADVLKPVATTDNTEELFGENPTFCGESDSLAWENFERGETAYYNNLQNSDRKLTENTPIISELQVPLNEHGIFLAATSETEIDNEYGRLKLAEILAANVEVALDRAKRMVELEETQAELEEMVGKLEESNTELEQFAYVASHDLQEPLRMITSYIQLIEMELDDDLTEDAEEYMEFITDGADRMKQLIDDLLKYSRVGTSEREHTSVDINNIVNDVKRDLKFRIDETDGQINIDDLPTINADEGQMNQLFQNLLSNALKYANENTPPVVSVYVDDEFDDTYRFAIEDNGEGIPEDQQERIFEVFTRGANEDDDTGTGIGLAVCNRIVEGHGGKMTVESTPGKGTTFYFTLNKDNTTQHD